MQANKHGTAHKNRHKIRRLKSRKVTAREPMPRSNQKNIIGMANMMNVGRLKQPMTQIAANTAHLFSECDGNADFILKYFTRSTVVLASKYFFSRYSIWNIIEFVCTIHSATMYTSNEHNAISMELEKVRVPNTSITNELANVNSRMSDFSPYDLHIW